jgi:ubiquinone/menaquinone biosynthesis C-methylase UbiE
VTRLFNLNAFYDWLAPFYATAMGLLPVWRRYTEAVLPHLPDDGAVLEIGPGPGLLLTQLAERYPMAAGLDLSTGMLRQAGARLRRAQLPACLSRGDATVLPFASGRFHGVALTFALSAIPDGQGAVQEMARVLRPGGTLALVDAGYPADGNLVGSALAKLWELGGDFMRDEAAFMRTAGLEIVVRQDFGAFDSIRLVVGRKPNER